MIDFAVGVLATLTVIRGYQRGIGRELVSLVVLILVAILSFRMAPTLGGVLESWAGVSSLAGRFIAVIGLFALLMTSAVLLVGRAFESRAASDPGDQVGGSAVSAVWLLGVLALLFYFVTALPLNDAADEALEHSTVAHFLGGENSAAGRIVNAVAGDRVLEALVNLDLVIGDRHVIIEGDQAISIPASDDLTDLPDDAQEVFELLNRARVEAGEAPLAFSQGLADVATGHAAEMYSQGYFSHVSATSGTVANRVTRAGIPFVVVGENLALAPTPATVHEGLMASPGHRENLLNPRYRRVGVAAISGPLGLMVVQVFTG
jgi:uncharacterized membrane protein required for colicin V production